MYGALLLHSQTHFLWKTYIFLQKSIFLTIINKIIKISLEKLKRNLHYVPSPIYFLVLNPFLKSILPHHVHILR